MPRIRYRFILAACLTPLAGTSLGQGGGVKFVSANALLAGPTPEAGLAACQPLQGDLAQVVAGSQKAYGTEVLPLRVVSGRCAGSTGWAGVARLEVAASVVATSSDAVGFSSSDSLFEALEPRAVKASCQPLRGDSAQLLEATRFAGTDVYRVKVLSGRCQGTTGWTGAARLERAASPPSR